MLLFCQQVKSQLYLISHLHMLILIYQIDVFYLNNFQNLNISQFYMPYYTHNHTYQDCRYNILYKNSNNLIIYTHTDNLHCSMIPKNILTSGFLCIFFLILWKIIVLNISHEPVKLQHFECLN